MSTHTYIFACSSSRSMGSRRGFMGRLWGNGGLYPKTKINLFITIINTTSIPNFKVLAQIFFELAQLVTDRQTDRQTDMVFSTQLDTVIILVYITYSLTCFLRPVTYMRLNYNVLYFSFLEKCGHKIC